MDGNLDGSEVISLSQEGLLWQGNVFNKPCLLFETSPQNTPCSCIRNAKQHLSFLESQMWKKWFLLSFLISLMFQLHESDLDLILLVVSTMSVTEKLKFVLLHRVSTYYWPLLIREQCHIQFLFVPLGGDNEQHLPKMYLYTYFTVLHRFKWNIRPFYMIAFWPLICINSHEKALPTCQGNSESFSLEPVKVV